MTVDSSVWAPSSTGSFSISHTIDWLSTQQQQKSWTHLIWNNFSIPRCKFSLWLAVQNRLPTLDHSCMRSFQGSRTCPLCNLVEESYNHLFFACSFTRPIWISLQHKGRFHFSPSSWTELVDGVSTRWSRRDLGSSVNKLLFSTTVNKIRLERNNWIFNNRKSSQMTVFREITALIREKLLTLSVKDSLLARRLKLDWDLPAFIRPPPEPPDRAM
ncbi:uncharacterized protein LOC132279015 [Cornus florida]|uniref:uncharacterized protein LOC132279015 n=1 Tax=Cornus florida TaxID=4283 RepID=UPI00289E19A9|nr:uncharacterized protein LOC132279015 [Cornus florida]